MREEVYIRESSSYSVHLLQKIYYSLLKELLRVPLCGAFVRSDFGVCSAFVRGMCGAMCEEGARNPPSWHASAQSVVIYSRCLLFAKHFELSGFRTARCLAWSCRATLAQLACRTRRCKKWYEDNCAVKAVSSWIHLVICAVWSIQLYLLCLTMFNYVHCNRRIRYIRE